MDVQQFIALWNGASSYPLNLRILHNIPNNGGLQAHRALLEANGRDLFTPNSDLAVFEYSENGGQPSLCSPVTIQDDNALQRYLPVPSTKPALAPSKARCRIIFFKARRGQEPLVVSQDHACKLLSYFQVMPAFIDFLSIFTANIGEQTEVSDQRFSSFRAMVRLSSNVRRLKLDHLCMDGRNFQMCYTLKSVANKTREEEPLKWRETPKDEWSWSIRQAAFHHQWDSSSGTSLWIVASAYSKLQARVRELTGHEGRDEDKMFNSPAESFVSSLAMHLLLAQWASEDWRGYLRWLEQVLEQRTKNALQARSYDPTTFELLFVQVKEDVTNKAVMLLDANADILESLQKFYTALMENDEFDLRDNRDCKRAVYTFLLQLGDYIHDMKTHSERAKTLAKITADRKNLIQQHLQARATDRVEKLTLQSQRETNFMKIIAAIQMVYLPATFACTFFSTDVVKYQDPDDGGKSNNSTGASGDALDGSSRYQSFSPLALERWAEVTVVLTIITFLAAYVWLKWRRMQYWVMPWRDNPYKDLEKRG